MRSRLLFIYDTSFKVLLSAMTVLFLVLKLSSEGNFQSYLIFTPGF